MTDTIRDLITDAFYEIGAYADGETPSASDMQLGLRKLNQWLDSQSIDRLQIPVITRTLFDLSDGVQAYSFAASNESTFLLTDQFEDPFVDNLPVNWIVNGDRLSVSASAIVSSGSQAVGMTTAIAGDTLLYRDIPARPNQHGELSFYLRSNAGGAAVVQVRNLATGNYLNSSGDWQAGATAALTDTGVPYHQFTISFTVESTADPRLRIEMTTGVGASLALFDQMGFSLRDEGVILIERPQFVNSVAYIDTANGDTLVEVPLEPLTEDGWAAVRAKAMESTLPTHYYYNPSYPEGTLNFWPIPTSSTLRGVIYVPTQVSEFSSVDDDATLPAGWRRMIVKNLALELCPSFEKQPSPLLVQQASQAIGAVKKVNRRVSDLSFDSAALFGTGYRYNIRTDQ